MESAITKHPVVLQPEIVDSHTTGNSSYQTVSAAELKIRLERLRKLARLMDGQFAIPLTGYRIGLDGLLGILPVGGDIATACVSGWIIREATQMGASREVIQKMCVNVAIDLAAGLVPVIGDLIDVTWKANEKNVLLLERFLLSSGALNEQHGKGR